MDYINLELSDVNTIALGNNLSDILRSEYSEMNGGGLADIGDTIVDFLGIKKQTNPFFAATMDNDIDKIEVLNFLLKINLRNLEEIDDKGRNIWHYIAEYLVSQEKDRKNLRVLFTLLEAKPGLTELLNEKDNEGNTPVDLAGKTKNYVVEGMLTRRSNREKPENKKVFELLKKEEVRKAQELIESKKMDVKATTKKGRNIVHIAAKKAKQADVKNMWEWKQLIECLEKQGKLKDLINGQDDDGNTPLLLAVKNCNQEFASFLKKKGGDPSIENNDEQYAISTEETEKLEDDENDEVSEETARKNISELFLGSQTSQTSQISQKSQELQQTNNPFETTEQSEQPTLSVNEEELEQSGGLNTEQFIEKLFGKNNNNIQNGGNHNQYNPFESELSNELNTEQFVRNVFEQHKNNNQSGGGYYNRKLNLYSDYTPVSDSITTTNNRSEFSFNYDSTTNYQGYTSSESSLISDSDEMVIKRDSSEDYSKSSSDNFELEKLMARQSNVIHKDVIEKIKELMDVDEEIARNYKSALWKKVKDDYPEITDNLSRSTKMKELTTVEVLESLDLQAGEEQRKLNREKSEKRAAEKQEKKEKKPAKKETKKPAKKEAKKPAKKTAKKTAKKPSKKTTKKKQSGGYSAFFDQTSSFEVPSNMNFSTTSDFIPNMAGGMMGGMTKGFDQTSSFEVPSDAAFSLTSSFNDF